MKLTGMAIIALFGSISFGQLSPEQKRADFMQLAGLYAKQYAPYEWKRETTGFDLYKIGSWLDRVDKSKDDLEFYDICIDYVGALKDTHDNFVLPSSFFVYLGFTVDIYDGKILVDGVNPILLPPGEYPIQIGDELASIDGQPATLLLEKYLRYSFWRGNPRSYRRTAAGMLTLREQFFIPRAHEIGETAEVVIRNAAGEERTHTIRWYKQGLPIPGVGPIPTPKAQRTTLASFGFPLIPPAEPAYMQPLLAMNLAAVPVHRGDAVRGLGSLAPVFDLPPGFQVRLGTRPLDNFVTGTYRAGGRNIGYIRIPRMTSTSSLAGAYQELETEIEFFQQNTDGLVVDIMRNLGGLLSYGHQLARRFIPAPFEGVGFEVRASATYVSEFSNELERAKRLGAPEHVVRTWTALLNGVYETYKENRGRTGVLPLDGHESLTFTPATNASGANLAYTMPLILLIDEYTCSTADLFAAVLQDAGRGPLVGMRTAGCGGSYGNHQFVPATVYSEGQTGVTQALMVRPKAIATPEFPTTRYIENVGVRPDIELDYMTRENLTQRGRPFLEAVTQLILDRIEAH